MKECQKSNKIAPKNAGHQVANNASKALLEAKNDFKGFTSQIIEEFKNFDRENTQPETVQQVACTSSYFKRVETLNDQTSKLLN